MIALVLLNIKKETQMNIYQERGFKSRTEYLEFLAEEYNVPLDVVRLLADTLGPEEDFDALLTSLDDVNSMW